MRELRCALESVDSGCPNQHYTKYSPTSIIRTSDIRYLDYPDLRRASRDNRLWSRAPTRGPRF